MQHGYTNDTERIGETVRKSYQGPEAAERAHAERTALSALEGLIPVPHLVAVEKSAVVTAFVEGEHGQDLIDAGHARQVLRWCGRVLRRLHALDPALIHAGPRPAGVIQHGDFGPNNVLFAGADRQVAAVLDWEFCQVGPAIADVAWCEWIVRMHHPEAVDQLMSFFDAYGHYPPWGDRQAEMLRRCAQLEDFARRWDPNGPAVGSWRQRAVVVSRWSE